VLENGDKIVAETGDILKKSNTLSDNFITRFSTIKFFATDKVHTKYTKDGEDYFNIEFPDYVKKEPIHLPIGNKDFQVAKTLKMIYDKIIIDEKV